MARHEYSIFQSIANHAKGKKATWGTATDADPMQGIDAFAFRNMPKVNARPKFKNLRSGFLTDETAVEWLRRQDSHTPGDVGPLDARIKILISDETERRTEKPDALAQSGEFHMSRESVDAAEEHLQPDALAQSGQFHMSRGSFDAAEEHLHLPVQTIPNLKNIWGIQSCEFIVGEGKRGNEATRLEITMNSTSIPELPRQGIGLSYDFSTRTTTAFVKGDNAVVYKGTDEKRKKDHNEYQPWILARRIRNGLSNSLPLWQHPLLVPVILLQHELAGIRNFLRDKLRSSSVEISSQMRVDYDRQAALLGGLNHKKDGKEDRVKFTNDLNELLCSAHSIRRALKVSQQNAAFLLSVADDIEKLDKNDEKFGKAADAIPSHINRTIKDTIKTFNRGAAGFEAGVDSIISNLEVQLSILSFVAAQIDSNRSAEMSAKAGLDSIAMKTLALVTAVFLPATFIATLFSLDMFDWQASSDSAVVSQNFWIFWAVSIPLSIFILGVWWFIWDLERNYYANRFAQNFQPGDPIHIGRILWDTLNKRHRGHGLKKVEVSSA
ncbi:hypothetical protein N0V93_008153 [Gnomoniopsis smithogilvyi]|uniref:Uncharacterized protein n=1 Tax=Gnomoniopsis smithogilvyi TaxID=1191159 RepID=A0A9W9CUG9_9PEZI|nr:hypothetical protein N0V93_008153 [Gnomoniopsis smithogilvyi]